MRNVAIMRWLFPADMDEWGVVHDQWLPALTNGFGFLLAFDVQQSPAV